MSIEKKLHTIDRMVTYEKRGITYIYDLIEGNFFEYAKVFPDLKGVPEEIQDQIYIKILALFRRLEHDTSHSIGTHFVQKMICQEACGPEYSLGWARLELVWWIEGTKKWIASRLLMEKSLNPQRIPGKSKFPVIAFEDEVEHILQTQPHQHVVELTDKGRAILNGYLKITGRDTIERMVEKNKQRLNKIAGIEKKY